MDKQYYLDKYNRLFDECLIEAGEESPHDVTAGANTLFEEYASAEHIVGYYIHNYGDDALKEWEKNLSYAKERWGKESEQDKEVSKILKELYPQQKKETVLPENITVYSSDRYSANVKVWCNALVGEIWDPYKKDYITKTELPDALLHAYENLCDFTGDDYLVEYDGNYYYMIDHVYNDRLAWDLNIHNNDELYAVALKNAITIANYDELKDTVVLLSKSSFMPGSISKESHYVSVLVNPYETKENLEKIKQVLDEHMFKLPDKEQEIAPHIEITNIAQNVRNEMVSTYGEDLAGYCIEASDKIAEKISSYLGLNAQAVEGWCRFDDEHYGSDRPWDPHTWVEVPSLGIYIDATADQFNYGMCSENNFPEVIVQKGLPHGMVYDEPTWDEFDIEDKYDNLKAVDIEWDVDSKEDLETLPIEIEIPYGMTDENEISDYLSEVTGFCHKGFNLIEYTKESLDIKPSLSDLIQNASKQSESNFNERNTKSKCSEHEL